MIFRSYGLLQIKQGTLRFPCAGCCQLPFCVALLMSTMTPIEFLILDEHTAALDPKTAETIMELTDRIVREKNLTTIMVTHNLRYAVDYGNRLLMMHQGKAIMDKAGTEKEETRIDDILKKFNEISIECGN